MDDRPGTEDRGGGRGEPLSHGGRDRAGDLSSYLQTVLEEERRRIARDIHDDLGQELASVKLEIALARRELSDGETAARARLSTIEALVDSSIRSVRRIITELRPYVLDDLGLTAAVEWQAAEFGKRTGLDVTVSVYPGEIILDPERSTALFRILQEGLSNITRHARATRVAVSLTEIDGVIEFELRDNGCGITPEQIADPRSFGLIGIRERVRTLGGTSEISGRTGEGTRLVIRFTATDDSLTP
jgi:signal transduction histidine kinase